MKTKQKFYFLLAGFQIVLIFIVFFSVNGITSFVTAQTESGALDFYKSSTTAFLALAAAISVSAAVLGSAWAMKTVGTAAISSLSEREESFYKAFLIVALCEALAVYGLIVAILIWTKIPQPAT